MCGKIHMPDIPLETDNQIRACRHFVFHKVYLWSCDITKVHFSIITYIYPSPLPNSLTVIQLLGEMFDAERKCWLVQATCLLKNRCFVILSLVEKVYCSDTSTMLQKWMTKKNLNHQQCMYISSNKYCLAISPFHQDKQASNIAVEPAWDR